MRKILQCKWIMWSVLWRFKSTNYFVSTPIFYVNGAPHIGHMQSCLYADALARVHRLLGKNILFSTGTDEHGLKVQQAAEASKKNPLDYCTEVSKMFEDIFRTSNVDFTHFIRTSSDKHKNNVQEFWRKLSSSGHIYNGKYEGWYSISDEAFVPSSQVKEVQDGKNTVMVSIETGNPVEKMSEENYVFSLSKFQNDLLHWLSKDVIKPNVFASDVRRWINEGLHDLSVSRPKSRLSWGIPVPEDDSQVIYVWLDALINYLTVAQSNESNIGWPADCHVIGKDILKFHAIYWPAFLIAAGYEPPSRIFCHSHWTVNYEKMSKTKGNVIDPIKLINKYSCDGFRYFLLRASVPHSDTNYSEEKILRMLNAELADTFGNLVSRSCAAVVNPSQVFPKLYTDVISNLSESNATQLIASASDLPHKVQKYFMEGNFYHGIDCIMCCLRDTNSFLQFNKPWELARKTDQNSIKTLSSVLHIVLEVLRISGLLLQPVMPDVTKRLLDKFKIPESDRMWENIVCFPSYHKMSNPLEGQMLEPDSLPLYMRRK